ncbi:hypothetical protein CEV32_1445 [Brucella rhizosphaerae]|uniref:Uncharacterized protein n=1 Tax=Brucella rhizosphaerae TaxID=571254 RepID=A0A256F8L0_9HYPH|nr:hypothetical protein CEV32_1445 [Brucella rhizosphaerae]
MATAIETLDMLEDGHLSCMSNMNACANAMRVAMIPVVLC